MNPVLIGSRALNYYQAGFDAPELKSDFDFMVDDHVIIKNDSNIRVECHKYSRHNGLGAFAQIANETGMLVNIPEIANPVVVPPLDMLYTLKLSHSLWPINWRKTMGHINKMRQMGAKCDENLFSGLVNAWGTIHWARKTNLNMSNEQFFNDRVKRKYVHDDIHKAIAYETNYPIYERCKQDKNRAKISRKMFEEMSHEDQVKMAREEIYVTALERFLIPKDFRMNIMEAYMCGAERLVCYMTSGWFPEFIVKNWKDFWKLGDYNYVKKFKEHFNE